MLLVECYFQNKNITHLHDIPRQTGIPELQQVLVHFNILVFQRDYQRTSALLSLLL
jgi:hypothetical protein